MTVTVFLEQDAVVPKAASKPIPIEVFQQRDGMLPGDLEEFLKIGDAEFASGSEFVLYVLLDALHGRPVIKKVF